MQSGGWLLSSARRSSSAGRCAAAAVPRPKSSADRAPIPLLQVAAHLQARGASALALHGDLEQRDRDKVLVRFRNGSCRILVATNVAARGLDVPGVALVVCYELAGGPGCGEAYTHRVGRTARANSEGDAVSLVAMDSELPRLDAVDAALATA